MTGGESNELDMAASFLLVGGVARRLPIHRGAKRGGDGKIPLTASALLAEHEHVAGKQGDDDFLRLVPEHGIGVAGAAPHGKIKIGHGKKWERRRTAALVQGFSFARTLRRAPRAPCCDAGLWSARR